MAIFHTCACWNLVSISPISHSKASEDSLNSSDTHLVHSVERTRHWKSRVAFSLACLLRWSSPATMMHFFRRSLTPVNIHRTIFISVPCNSPLYTNYKTNYLHQCIVLKIFYTLKPSTHIKINFKITPTCFGPTGPSSGSTLFLSQSYH